MILGYECLLVIGTINPMPSFLFLCVFFGLLSGFLIMYIVAVVFRFPAMYCARFQQTLLYIRQPTPVAGPTDISTINMQGMDARGEKASTSHGRLTDFVAISAQPLHSARTVAFASSALSVVGNIFSDAEIYRT